MSYSSRIFRFFGATFTGFSGFGSGCSIERKSANITATRFAASVSAATPSELSLSWQTTGSNTMSRLNGVISVRRSTKGKRIFDGAPASILSISSLNRISTEGFRSSCSYLYSAALLTSKRFANSLLVVEIPRFNSRIACGTDKTEFSDDNHLTGMITPVYTVLRSAISGNSSSQLYRMADANGCE